MRFAAMQAPADRPGLDQASLARAIASDRATIGGVLRRFGRTGIVLRRPAPRRPPGDPVGVGAGGACVTRRTAAVAAAVQRDILSNPSDAGRDRPVALVAEALRDRWAPIVTIRYRRRSARAAKRSTGPARPGRRVGKSGFPIGMEGVASHARPCHANPLSVRPLRSAQASAGRPDGGRSSSWVAAAQPGTPGATRSGCAAGTHDAAIRRHPGRAENKAHTFPHGQPTDGNRHFARGNHQAKLSRDDAVRFRRP